MFIFISVLISWVSFCSFASHLCSKACYSAPRFDGNQCTFLEQSLGAIWASSAHIAWSITGLWPSSTERIFRGGNSARVAQRAKQEELKHGRNADCTSLTVEEIRKRAAQKKERRRHNSILLEKDNGIVF
jgi:hypothetical protein